MTNILDRVAKSARKLFGQFRPTTTEEFFALRLSLRLGDSLAARHYADLAQQYSQSQLLSVYGRTVQSGSNLARRFHILLHSIQPNNGGRASGETVAGIRIERRAVGVAVLRGDHLVHADARQLSTTADKAISTAVGFVTRLLEKLRCQSVVFECSPSPEEVQRHQIQQAVSQALAARAAIVELPMVDALASFGYPPTRFRRDVRTVISEIYPSLRELPGLPWTLDAAALGLYAHTEHLFNSINETLS